MSRYVNPTPQYLDDAGDPVVSGKLFFYESEQNLAKSTFADQQQTILNTNPVILDSAGRTPNTFYTGTARVVLQNSSGVQLWERDPVGGENAFSDFGQWLNYITYDVNDIVEVSNQFYLSKTIANQNNDPSVSPGSNTNWTLINFLGLFNTSTTYPAGAIVFTSNGKIFASVVSSNLNNNPLTDEDGDFWTTSLEFPIPKTTSGLIASSEIFAANIVLNTSGYATSGDGGAAPWKQNGVTGQTVSRSPLQLNNALLNDAAGNQWALVANGPVSELALGPSATAAIAAASTFGTAATADVTTSAIDTTADRLLRVGDFGAGSLTSVNYPITSIDTATGVAGGLYRYLDTNTGTLPAGFSGFGNIWVNKYDADNASQIIIDLTGKSAFRHIVNDGSQAWNVNLTTGNTGANLFPVNSGKVLKSIGIAQLTTAVDFDVDAMGLIQPTSITKSGGFNIIDATTGSSVASSVLPALHSTSSARNAVLRFTVTGATIGGLYRAVAATNSSITVNF